MNRPFEGGFEATSGIFVVIYYQVLIAWNQLSAAVSNTITSNEANLCNKD